MTGNSAVGPTPKRYRTLADSAPRLSGEADTASNAPAQSSQDPTPEANLTERQAIDALTLLEEVFSPALLSRVAVSGNEVLSGLARNKYPNASAALGFAADAALVAIEASGQIEPRFGAKLLSDVRSGGGLVLALGATFDFVSAWDCLLTLRQAGWLDATLVDMATVYGGENGPRFFITARRPRIEAGAAVPRSEPSSRADVSVIIPLYNHEKYIEAALESVFGQTRPPAEVIVIDDGSSDRSPEIAMRLCSRYEGAVFWRQTNRGAHNTINAGLQRATRPVLAILNSDDIYRVDRLELCLAAMERNGAGIVASGIHFIDAQGTYIENPWYVEALAYLKEIGNTSLALLNGNFLMTTSNLVIHRRVLQDAGYFRNYRYAHDLEFFVRVLARSHRLFVHEEAMLDYRYHPGNTIKEDHTRVRIEWAFILSCIMRRCSDSLLEGMNRWTYLEALNGIAMRHNLGQGILLMLSEMLHDLTADPELDLITANPVLHASVYRSLS